MINEKYYNDIKKFPTQFKEGFELAKNFKVEGKFERVVICGMGGSSLYVDLINDILESETKDSIRIEVSKSYGIPSNSNEKTLFIVASYSGNTEESLAALDEIKKRNFSKVIITAGGKLIEIAKKESIVYHQIPSGLQPRLSTGYFITAVLSLLENIGLVADHKEKFIKMGEKLDGLLDEEYSKKLAEQIKGKAPVIYGTENNASIAKISKIKFNENSKTQAFANFFPELNHNEMVGFSNLVMNPFFIIFKSKFTFERNYKRIAIFSEIMTDKGATCEVIDLKGDNNLEEMMFAYYLTDHVTFYLAEAYGIDPEPVSMVEEFKKLLEK